MNKSIDPQKYNKEYFYNVLNSTDYTKNIGLDSFNHIYKKAGDIIQLNKNDYVVDLGCGSGHLAFYLFLKYHCSVLGIDYSMDAIGVCRENLESFLNQIKGKDIQNKIKFLQTNNEELPILDNIKAVFLVDVVEHLYDNELDVVFNKIIKWNNSKRIDVVIHTDNVNYLKFIRPFIDMLSVIFGKNTMKNISERNKWEKERHINLTAPRKLGRNLQRRGFRIRRVEYPDIDLEILKTQLGGLAKIKIFLYSIAVFAKLLFFLRPSFYMVAHYNTKNEIV